MARRARPGLVVGRSHRMGDHLHGPLVAWGQSGAGDLGRAVLRYAGDRSLERVHVVSDAVAANLLGASAAGYRSHDGAWRPLPGDWGSAAGASASDVSLVASGPGRDAPSCTFPAPDAPA